MSRTPRHRARRHRSYRASICGSFFESQAHPVMRNTTACKVFHGLETAAAAWPSRLIDSGYLSQHQRCGTFSPIESSAGRRTTAALCLQRQGCGAEVRLAEVGAAAALSCTPAIATRTPLQGRIKTLWVMQNRCNTGCFARGLTRPLPAASRRGKRSLGPSHFFGCCIRPSMSRLKPVAHQLILMCQLAVSTTRTRCLRSWVTPWKIFSSYC